MANLRPHPTALDGSLYLSSVESHRNLDCSHYSSCLNLAASSGWETWSCSGCPLKGCKVAPSIARTAFSQPRN
jgi:hypothetical protein